MDGFIQVRACGGELTVSGVSLSDVAGRWFSYDLLKLFSDWSDRGQDLVMPGVPGRRAKPRRFDATRFLLPIVFSGWVDSSGDVVPWDDRPAQLAATMETFITGVVGDPTPGVGDGTRPATYVDDNGSVWSARMHVVRLRRRQTWWGGWDGDLEVVVPVEWQITQGVGS